MNDLPFTVDQELRIQKMIADAVAASHLQEFPAPIAKPKKGWVTRISHSVTNFQDGRFSHMGQELGLTILQANQIAEKRSKDLGWPVKYIPSTQNPHDLHDLPNSVLLIESKTVDGHRVYA